MMMMTTTISSLILVLLISCRRRQGAWQQQLREAMMKAARDEPTLTALDASVARGRPAEEPAGPAAGPTAPAPAAGAPSDLFQAGRAYERHRDTNLSQEAFLKLLYDLQTDAPGTFRIRERTSSLDFVGGRLFERLCDGRGPSAVMPPEDFQRVWRLAGVNDLFLAGRVFERVASTEAGLSAGQFQRACRESALGQALLLQIKVDPGLLDRAELVDKAAAAPSRSATNDLAHVLRDLLGVSALGPQEAAVENQAEGPAASDAGKASGSRRDARRSPEVEVVSREVDKRLAEVRKLDQQVAAFEEELGAERALKAELPEAASEAKIKMLAEHVSGLKEKRRLVLKALRRLGRQKRANLSTGLDSGIRPRIPGAREGLYGAPYPGAEIMPTLYPFAPYESAAGGALPYM